MSDKTKYIFLRDESRAGVQSRSPAGEPRYLCKGPQAAAETSGPFQMVKGRFNRKQLADLRRDPKNYAFAEAMPTSLAPPSVPTLEIPDERAWGLEAIGLPADCKGTEGQGVSMAVLDTGLDASHEAFNHLNGKIEYEDFTLDEDQRKNKPPINDDSENGHGTHCAGIIFGSDVGGKRIGIAPAVERVLIGKVLRKDGSGDSEMIFDGLQWAVERGADVISMSLSFSFTGFVDQKKALDWPEDLAMSVALVAFKDNLRLLDNLMQRIQLLSDQKEGAVVIGAAGNQSQANKHPDYRIATSLPAAAAGVISVGALARQKDKPRDRKYEVASFSNTLPRLTAPGVGVMSAAAGSGNGLKLMSGTSMAAAHVAGIAALWWQHLSTRDVNPQMVQAHLLSNVRDTAFVTGTVSEDRGDGLVQAPLLA